jgi:hypothetical protein
MELYLKLEQNKYYYCVESLPILGIVDISIFTKEEWESFLEMSKKFEDEYYKSVNYTYWEYNQLSREIQDNICFLKYKCDFCNIGFSELSQEYVDKLEISDHILTILRDNDHVSVDKFREWLINNKSEMERNFINLQE